MHIKGGHMRRLNLYLLAGIAALFACTAPQNLNAQGDELSQKATRFVGENAVKYIQPAIDAFSANLNSGLYHTADVHDVLGFEIGLVGMVAPVPDRKKTFVAIAPDSIISGMNKYVVGIDYDPFYTTSTALGSKQGTKVYRKQSAPGSPSIYEFPGGLDIGLAPLLVPQLSVGLPLGTEFVLRYVPEISIHKDVGKFKHVGIGLRHSISQWLPGPSLVGGIEQGKFPLDLSVNLMYQKFTVTDTAGGDFFKTELWSVGVQASKRLLIFTFYGGLAYESATTDITYTYRPVSEYYPEARNRPVDVRLKDIKADNNFRATVGLNVHLLLLNIFADYSLASQPVASVGLVLTIR